ncbi:hypothetical protein QM012_001194 [Aureobasidium pullulans]|uniref:RING-type domain-containing protein n=1 Tax=Aureobasidium pullulans TaxID=5580 RepID=A0ABR0TFY3_AURPU
MPVETVEHLLRENLIPMVKAREAEMSTPASDRTYCAGCAKFIPRDRIYEKRGICPDCWTSTCTECKEKGHVGDCESKLQKDIRDLEALAEKKGWKKCSKCLMLVEHNTGCNHMTCRCKNQFCYLCVREWKKCDCPFMDLGLLLTREEQRGAAPLGLDTCTHGDWEFFLTSDYCDYCGDHLPDYLYRCLGCYLQYCKWCTYNRGLGVA